MKKLFVLFGAIFINSLLTAQVVLISDSIIWQSNQIFIDNDGVASNILYFDGALNRSIDNLPVYYFKTKLEGEVYVDEIEIVNVNYEVVNKEKLEGVKFIDKIFEEPDTKSYVSKFRKSNYLTFELLPLRKNVNTGEIEKLVFFEYKVHYKYSSAIKKSQINTYASALASGNWYKIRVQASGMYKLTYSQLSEMGFTNFNNIGVFGYGGLLPKTVGSEIYDDLPEMPVKKVDVNSNSVFDSGDYLLFYANGPHNIYWDAEGLVSHEYHAYSEYSYYFVSDRGTWKQPASQASLSNYDVEISKYDDYAFLEKDSINLIHSGRNLYWREFDYYLSYNFTKTFQNVSTSDTAEIKVMLAARSSVESYFNLNINGVAQPTISLAPTSSSTTSVYAKTNTLNTFYVKPSSSVFSIGLTYNKTSSNSKGWLDYISIKVRSYLKMSNNYIKFRDAESIAIGSVGKFKISNATSSTIVWDITDPINAKKINGSLNGSVYSFNADVEELREYIAFNVSSSFPSPEYNGSTDLGMVANQNLHSKSPVDLVIVTHPDFMSQAEAIGQIHENYDGMSVYITTPENIYNEFSSGTPDVSAIRNFMKMLYDRANTEDEIPESLLLLGDGSYDNLSNDPLVTNFILTYQSEYSLLPTSSYVSDDYYVFLDDGEGSVSNLHDIDVGVGRLPVKTTEEASAYVNKLQTYYSTASYGSWKNKILLIGDDAEGGETLHQIDCNKLGILLDTAYPVFNLEKVFLDDFEQISTVQGHKYPDVNQAINDNINNGVLMVNWVGHGNEKGWAHESVLTLNMIGAWQNTNKFPIFFTATCEFSPWDHHLLVSAGEEVLLNPNGGGIALFTTTRLAFASSNAKLASAFYENVFTRDSQGRVYPLGLSAIRAKNLVGDTNKKVFTLLGDPAIRPSVPNYIASTTKINGVDVASFNDTVQATSLVTFDGIITDADGNLVEDFKGVIYPTVYDKRMEYTTRGNDGYPPLEYTAQKNIIFNGQASVVNGKFSFSFIVPIDIAYFYDFGKVSYYAHNGNDIEAAGYDESFLIGGSAENNLNDNVGPEIQLFMNNEQFVPGGITDENPLLLAQILDESGINTVSSGIGHDITLTFDENTADVFVLNKFYESKMDDFTSGEVNYPMSQLDLGPHTLKVKAWDVLNNSGEAVTDFIVANSAELVIDHLFNYPNPFSTSTDFYFDHNQPNQALDVIIQVFTVSGKHVKTIEDVVMSDGFRSHPIHWDGKDEYGDKIGKGVYVYKIKVRNSTGNIVEEIEKLVILN